MTAVTLGLFSTSVVARLARDSGRFAARGLEVVEAPVRSSREQFRSLADGTYDLVLTSPDNVLGRRGAMDVRILAAVDRGLGLSLVAAPDVRAPGDLRGRRVAVDVPDSGFAFTLYRILGAEGLRPGRDYEVVTAGATPRRRERLLAGDFAATMLGAGHDLAAVGGGCRRLARVADVVRPYLGTVLATTGDWLAEHPRLAGRFMDAWLAAAAEVADPAAADAVRAAVARHMDLAGRDVEEFYRVLVSPGEGVVADGRVDPAALAALEELRAEAGQAADG